MDIRTQSPNGLPRYPLMRVSNAIQGFRVHFRRFVRTITHSLSRVHIADGSPAVPEVLVGFDEETSPLKPNVRQ